ncbi:MAG: N-acetylneuraminate synthase family protein [Bacteroidetes bacterium]|nr:N-acetylneuraminate synthase family protein [Bacteroidota bacterium]
MDFNKLEKPYLIAEIGINHNGDIQNAKKLIDASFACSWDCVKFQKRNPELSVPDHQKKIERDTPWGKMTYLEYKYRVEFEKKEYDIIDQYCKEKPLDWTASVWDIDSLNFMKQYDVPFIKIPSAHLTNDEVLIESCKTNIPIIISTGMSTLEEIDHGVEILKKYAKSFAILHANSSYPASLDELNLKMIPTLIDRYNCAVGYSGHEFGLDSTTMAVALGATIVERHITFDHTMWGTDQSSSVEIAGMDKLYKQISTVARIMGDGHKVVYESEMPIRKKLRGY